MKSTLSLLLVFLNHFFMPRHNAQGMRSQPVNGCEEKRLMNLVLTASEVALRNVCRMGGSSQGLAACGVDLNEE